MAKRRAQPHTYKLVVDGQIRTLTSKEFHEAVRTNILRIRAEDKTIFYVSAHGQLPVESGLVLSQNNRYWEDYRENNPAIEQKIVRTPLETILQVDTVAPTVIEIVPEFGEKILSFIVSPSRLEAVMGDLEQGYRRIARRHGTLHATRWYYWHVGGVGLRGVITSVGKLLYDCATKFITSG